MELFVVYLAAMTLPGALLVRVLDLDFHRFGFSIALSFSVFVLALALAKVAGFGAAGFGLVLVACYAMVIAAWLWRIRRGGPGEGVGMSLDGVYLIALGTLSCVAAYLLWAGPYTEVPSDAWWHIGRINDRLEALGDGDIGSVHRMGNLLSKQAGYWYTSVAYFLSITHTDLQSALGALSLANSLLFSVGVYSFALFVFRRLTETRAMQHAMAAGAVFFFFAHFGLSVFSYVRYYVYAPTILNYGVYLSALACALKFMETDEPRYRLPAVALVLGAVAAMVHTQEAMFIVVVTSATVVVQAVQTWRGGDALGGILARRGPRARVLVLAGIIVVAYGALHVWAYVTMDRHNPLNHNVMADIENYLPFIRNLYVLKPTYQFYQVLTVWGVLVYVMFIVRAGEFSRSPYLIAGMLLPVLTVFNPVFADLFLRFSWPEVLWRVCYALPLPLVGGYLLATEVKSIVAAPRLTRKAGALLATAALLVLLLPAQTTFFVSPFSKIYTLAPVGARNDYRMWQDLLDFLHSRRETRVVTDPVTGYVINGLTGKKYPGYKFYGFGALAVDNDSYSVNDFEFRKGWLLVINERNGAPSDVGRYGRHWRARIMEVSDEYSSAFLSFVRDNPGLFKSVWTRDRIAVYRIGDARKNGAGASAD